MAELLRMPRLSLTMTEGRITVWLKREGDQVKAGEIIASIESDKASFDIEATQEGILRRILVQAGEEALVDVPLAVIASAEEDISAALANAKAVVHAAQAPGTIEAGTVVSGSLSAARKPLSPAARRIAQEQRVEITEVLGTGPDGLVTEKDVRAFIASKKAESASEGDQVLPLTGVRRRMAERMALSRHTAADVTTVAEVDMTLVAAQRQQSGLSYTTYVAWAVSRALCDFPILNSSLVGERILLHKNIHIGIAVALEEALLVPVLKDADRKSLEEIGSEIDQLAALARDGKLMPEALTGSTFTITNSGAFGSLLFTPIINQPEVAILGMGKVADTPVVLDGQIVARKIMYLCLSYDHRVVEGAVAVKFLQTVKRRLEGIADLPVEA